MEEKPYIETPVSYVVKSYNPNYGDNRICQCGHTYYRHFDSYEDMEAVGCKYCACNEFVEMPTIQMSELKQHDYINYNGEVITKEQALKIIESGEKPDLYTVSDEYIQEALHATYVESKENNGVVSDSYCAQDLHTKRIIY